MMAISAKLRRVGFLFGLFLFLAMAANGWSQNTELQGTIKVSGAWASIP